MRSSRVGYFPHALHPTHPPSARGECPGWNHVSRGLWGLWAGAGCPPSASLLLCLPCPWGSQVAFLVKGSHTRGLLGFGGPLSCDPGGEGSSLLSHHSSPSGRACPCPGLHRTTGLSYMAEPRGGGLGMQRPSCPLSCARYSVRHLPEGAKPLRNRT